MVKINVQKNTPTTFVQWTDGPKYVFDASLDESLKRPEDNPNFEYTIIHPNNLVKHFERNFKVHHVGTFFVIADLEDAYDLFEKRSDLDIRLLLV